MSYEEMTYPPTIITFVVPLPPFPPNLCPHGAQQSHETSGDQAPAPSPMTKAMPHPPRHACPAAQTGLRAPRNLCPRAKRRPNIGSTQAHPWHRPISRSRPQHQIAHGPTADPLTSNQRREHNCLCFLHSRLIHGVSKKSKCAALQ